MTARELLGSSHPLTRAARRVETACAQLLCGLAILAGIVVFAHGAARDVEIAASAAACALLGIAAAGAWWGRRERALELIIAGDEGLPLSELEPLRRRLRDGRRRARLAASLERCLRAAEEWDRTLPRLRPVANVRLLLEHESIVREIASLLRSEAVACARGVALCEWLLSDGVASPLYCDDGDALRRELGRIRFALDAG
jgi:hypothetical protein